VEDIQNQPKRSVTESCACSVMSTWMFANIFLLLVIYDFKKSYLGFHLFWNSTFKM
jgi:hypothetical protein